MNLDVLQSRFGRLFGLLGAGGLSLLTLLDSVRLALRPHVPFAFVLTLLLSTVFALLLAAFIWRAKGRELRFHPLTSGAAVAVFAAFGAIGLGYLGVALALDWTLAVLLAGIGGLCAFHLLLVPEGSGLAV